MDKRPNLVLAVVTGAVVVLAVIAAVLSANPERPTLDPATPEGTAQLFVIAMLEGDPEFGDYLDPALGCDAPVETGYTPEAVSMTVAGSTTTGDRASVRLDVTESGGGLFGTYTHRETFQLERNGAGWRLSEVPWPLYSCR